LSDRLRTPLKRLYERHRLSLFVVDEAHCISEWGHDFRAAFLRLSQFKELFPTVPAAAFTATATPTVRNDIVSQLRLSQPQMFLSAFNRPNLRYDLRYKGEKREREREREREGSVCDRDSCDGCALSLLLPSIRPAAQRAGRPAAHRGGLWRRVWTCLLPQ